MSLVEIEAVIELAVFKGGFFAVAGATEDLALGQFGVPSFG